MILRQLFFLLLFVFSQQCFGQNLKLKTTSYDSLHQYLITTHLTHYRLYFKDTLVYDWQDPDCSNEKINTASLMKSITTLAVGELLENGYIESLEDPVCKYVPEWKSGCENGVSIKHLLTMTSGLLKKAPAERGNFFLARDWNAFVYEMNLDTVPGVKWGYSNEAGQLLEPIIERASKMDAQDFFDKYVFNPLEMNNTVLFQDEVGNYSTIGGASTHMDDLSNFGLAVLNEGMFKDHQVIDPEYLSQALTPIKQNNYYGYLWWLDEQNECYTAMGDGGTMVIVYPEKDLVFVRANNCKTGRVPMNWMGPQFIQNIAAIVEVQP